jgi:hypothetical protein
VCGSGRFGPHGTLVSVSGDTFADTLYSNKFVQRKGVRNIGRFRYPEVLPIAATGANALGSWTVGYVGGIIGNLACLP